MNSTEKPAPTEIALAALEGARHARSDPDTAERSVLKALEYAPDDLDVRLGAYRFYFYNHRFEAALPHAEFIIAHAARRLNIPVNWREVRPGDAPFGELEHAPGLYLQALTAWGYCKLRLGDQEEGCEALAKVVKIDPNDRFGAGAILNVIEAERPEDL